MCHLLTSQQILLTIQYVSAAVAILGTILMAMKLLPPRVAFLSWLISYLMYVPYYGLSAQWGMFAGAVCGATVSLIGVIQWRKARKNGRDDGGAASSHIDEQAGME